MKTTEAKIDQEVLLQHLSYDERTGRLTWKERSVDSPFCSGSSESRLKGWNTRYAGSRADASIDSSGYRRVCLGHKHYIAHRIVWMMQMGAWPETIDHINGVKTDNRMENLRDVSIKLNSLNRPKQKNNQSGVTGVKWSKSCRKWEAAIQVNGEKIGLGFFLTFEMAAEARKKAEAKYGFHENHGRPAINRGNG